MEKEDYNSIGRRSLAEAYVGYMSMTDREKVDTDTLGSEIASAVDNVRGGLDPGEWALEILKNVEKSKNLEEKAAKIINEGIVEQHWNIDEHTGLVRDILSGCGIHRINYNGKSKALSRANDTFLTNYCWAILGKYIPN